MKHWTKTTSERKFAMAHNVRVQFLTVRKSRQQELRTTGYTVTIKEAKE